MKREVFSRLFPIASIIILVSAGACKSNLPEGKMLVESFEIETAIKGDPLQFSEELIMSNFWLVDSLLIIKSGIPYGSFVEEDYIFYLYNKNSLERVGQFGKPGRGPGELMDPEPTGQFIRTDTATLMVIHLRGNRRLIGMDLNRVIAGDKTEMTTILAGMPGDLEGSPLTPLLTPEKGVIGSVMGSQARFFYWNGNDLSFVGFFPESSRIVPDQMMHNVYISNSSLSPCNKLFVSALRCWKQIDFFSSELDYRYSIVFPDSPADPEIITQQGVPSPDVVVYFIGLHVSERYVYVLHQGNKIFSDDDYNTTVYLFSHSGQPVARLETNPRIRYFSVDKDDKYLYGTYYDENGDMALVRFLLPL